MGSLWCNSCTKRVVAALDDGRISCTSCGKVLAEDYIVEERTFEKGPGGIVRASGTIERTTEEIDTIDKRLRVAYQFIKVMAENMGVGGGDEVTFPAKQFYRMALERNFVQGRRGDVVGAACLYIACRVKKKPLLLIEFAHELRLSVYVLGGVFLQLCRVLNLAEHSAFKRVDDPSLYVHRFVHGLLGEGNRDVVRTALKIVTSMKHNWINTGRKPSGIFGAALYLSALSHGHKYSKADVVNTVHICEGTLTKRLIEFEETESGGLSMEEFEQRSYESERTSGAIKRKDAGICIQGELLCEHKDNGVAYFAHGLCETCYEEFLKISGGLDGGCDPPAFQRAERVRSAKASLNGGSFNSGVVTDEHKHESVNCVWNDEDDDSENLSEVDDAEIDNCIHNEEEREYKKIAWEQMNPEYDLKQALKAAAGVDVAEVKRKRKRKGDGESKTAKTAAEAVHQELKKKRVSSRINLDALKHLFGEPDVSEAGENELAGSCTGNSVETDVYEQQGTMGETDEYEQQETMGEDEDDCEYQQFHSNNYYEEEYAYDLDGDYNDGLY